MGCFSKVNASKATHVDCARSDVTINRRVRQHSRYAFHCQDSEQCRAHRVLARLRHRKFIAGSLRACVQQAALGQADHDTVSRYRSAEQR